jgi:toxin ParE1/3/4
MGRRLVILPLAQKDLDGILDYTTRIWGSKQAERYYARILKTFGLIAEKPDRGTRRENASNGIFSRRAGRHHVFYKTAGDTIKILRILHERMNFKRRVH